MTTTRGLDQKEYNGIRVGERLHNVEYGFTGKVVCFDFERGDVYTIVDDDEGKEHGALMNTYEFCNSQEPDGGDIYHCDKCGAAISAAEADDNGGKCGNCAKDESHS